MKILMVLTSHDELGNTGRKTGFWLEELAAPYYVFKDAAGPTSPVGSRRMPTPTPSSTERCASRIDESDTPPCRGRTDEPRCYLFPGQELGVHTIAGPPLITGQNPASSGPAAKLLIDTLNKQAR